MHKQLNDLKDGGWKSKPHFAKCPTSLDGISIQSDHSADREFFYSLPDTFIKLYEKTLNKAVLSHWRNDKLIVYKLGGQPELAQELVCKIDHHRENIMVGIDEQGKALNNVNRSQYQFTNTATIELDEIHKVTQGPVKVNVKECMENVTEIAGFKKVAMNDLVEAPWDLIASLVCRKQRCLLECFAKTEHNHGPRQSMNPGTNTNNQLHGRAGKSRAAKTKTQHTPDKTCEGTRARNAGKKLSHQITKGHCTKQTTHKKATGKAE